MKVVSGFAAAEKLLARRAGFIFPELSPRMKERLVGLFGTENPAEAVARIIADVRAQGDAALFGFTSKIDGIRLISLEVPAEEMSASLTEIPSQLLSDLTTAANRVRRFHEKQQAAFLAGIRKMAPGTVARTLKRVGLYVPGGTASYPSSVLMTAIPAKVAGVADVIMATPPDRDGKIPARTLAAASLAGVDRVFAIGGAQAIAAMAYGTQSVPRVDKICGPGNLFVMLAKQQVYGSVDIDGLEGPSEVVVLADAAADPLWVAWDLLAQAEHDTLAQSILITTSDSLARAVQQVIEAETSSLERRAVIEDSLNSQGIIAVVATLDEAVTLANIYGPEHLCLYLAGAEEYLPRIEHAGCVFIGLHPTVVMGDYVAGPSHALPTGGTARFASPLNVTDFTRLMNVIDVDKDMLSGLSATAARLAREEGLSAHARAIEEKGS